MILSILLGTIVIIIYSLSNYYIGLRGYSALKDTIHALNPHIYWAVFIALAVSLILGIIDAKFVGKTFHNIISLIGYYWMAAWEYFILAFIITDAVRLIFKISSSSYNHINLCIIFLVPLVLIYGTYHANDLKLKKYNITINKQPQGINGLNIVMVSDIHIGEIIKNKQVSKMVNNINALNPDVVLLCGDIVDNKIEPFKEMNMKAEFEKIKSKYGVYGILGNHEYYGTDLKETEAAYRAAGINLLVDETLNVADKFCIIGRNDATANRTKDKRKFLSSLVKEADLSLPVLLMDHQPYNLNEAKDNNVDIQFSGHTHAGQYFPNNIVTYLMYKDHWGYLKLGNTNYFVSSGYGTWGPPIRVATDSEIIQVNVTFKK